jgi:hypothetical protein
VGGKDGETARETTVNIDNVDALALTLGVSDADDALRACLSAELGPAASSASSWQRTPGVSARFFFGHILSLFCHQGLGSVQVSELPTLSTRHVAIAYVWSQNWLYECYSIMYMHVLFTSSELSI